MSEHNLSFRPNISPEEPDHAACEAIRRSIGVWDDLMPEQRQRVEAHLRSCPACTAEHLVISRATRLLATLEMSSPSARVDKAVMDAMLAQSKRGRVLRFMPISSQKRRTHTLQLAGLLMAAVVVLVATFTTVRIMKTPSAAKQAFLLPATLSWSAYILYHSQTKIDARGKRYHVESYHQLNDGYLNVETVQAGMVHVVLIDDGHNTLGMDEMRHIAQYSVQGWGIDVSQEALFDVNELRREIAMHQASYLDTDMFRGTAVYRLHCANGLVLLLDMKYNPVNILAGAVGPGTGEPIYDRLSLLPPTKVAASMWNMQVPAGFTMGVLPAPL